MENTYSPKEILILESVVKMFMEGVSLHNIKVADIAAGAGIGKGTVYEYFSSKEEIISKAVAYRIWQELENIGEEVAAADSFAHCTQRILNRAFDCGHNFCSCLVFRPELPQLAEVYNIVQTIADLLLEKEREVVTAYLNLGIKEGIIDKDKAESIGFQTVTGVFLGFNALCQRLGLGSQGDLVQGAYEIITGALSK